MLTLISGQPGNGKSLMAMDVMRSEYERNKAANALPPDNPKHEELRRFFTNIEGATQAENPGAFPWVELLEPSADWTTLPHGSFVVYDEAHSDGKTPGLERYGRLFPGTGKPGESDDPRIRAMSTHRHYGVDLVFITQWPSKIHHDIRRLAGAHIHMNRALGMERAGVLRWSRVQSDPYDESQRGKAEEEIWAFPKDLYGRFKSATLHTSSHKFRMPKKVWEALARLVALMLVVWGLYWWVGRNAPEAPPATKAQAPAGAGGSLAPSFGAPVQKPVLTREQYVDRFTPRIQAMPYSAPAYDERPVVAEPRAYCMLSGSGVDAQGNHRTGGCRCITEQGTRYLMAFNECRAVVMAGGVYNPFQRPRDDPRGPRERDALERGAGASPAVSGALGAAPAPEAVVGVTSAEPVASYGGFRTGG